MTNNIEIICDRCGKTVHGIVMEAAEGLPKITGGFYDVAAPSVWGEFALSEDEKNVCDGCMWENPAFIAKYPINRKVPSDTTPTTLIPKSPDEIISIQEASKKRRATHPAQRIAMEKEQAVNGPLPKEPKDPKDPKEPKKNK